MARDGDDPDNRRPDPGPPLPDDDLVLRALRSLPPLTAGNDARVHARATTCFRAEAARQRRLARKVARLARPILPLSIAGLALGYLIWAFRTAAMFLQ
jgi:hypothetical protein